MKTHRSLPLRILPLLVAMLSIAAAPLASRTAALTGVVYVPGKGPVFTFAVSGRFSKAQLKGILHIVGGVDYSLHCAQADETTVKCLASQKISGVNVVLFWGGFKFWAYAPEGSPRGYCYTIYDWQDNPPTVWVSAGRHCQDSRADYGDLIHWYNPDWGWSDYEFRPASPPSPYCNQVNGDAYYYPVCLPIGP